MFVHLGSSPAAAAADRPLQPIGGLRARSEPKEEGETPPFFAAASYMCGGELGRCRRKKSRSLMLNKGKGNMILKRHSSGVPSFHTAFLAKPNCGMANRRNSHLTMANFQISQLEHQVLSCFISFHVFFLQLHTY
jgi:hypothetical protein